MKQINGETILWKGNTNFPVPGKGKGPKANQPPVLQDDTGTVEAEETLIIGVLANDSDPEGGELTLLSASALQGAVTIRPDNTLVYTAPGAFAGVDTITYSAADPEGLTAVGTAVVTVTTPPPVLPLVGALTTIQISSATTARLFFDSDTAGTYRLAGTGVEASGSAVSGANDITLTGLSEGTLYDDLEVTVTVGGLTSLPAVFPAFTPWGFAVFADASGNVSWTTADGAGAIDVTVSGVGSPYDGTYTMDSSQLASGPVSLLAPGIAGAAEVGRTLSIRKGLWISDEDNGTFSVVYVWFRDGTPISGSENADYTVGSGDAGSTITVRETGTDSAGSRQAVSTGTRVITGTARLEGSASTAGITITFLPTLSTPTGSASTAGITITG